MSIVFLIILWWWVLAKRHPFQVAVCRDMYPLIFAIFASEVVLVNFVSKMHIKCVKFTAVYFHDFDFTYQCCMLADLEIYFGVQRFLF